jgi:hypothetical protein
MTISGKPEIGAPPDDSAARPIVRADLSDHDGFRGAQSIYAGTAHHV